MQVLLEKKEREKRTISSGMDLYVHFANRESFFLLCLLHILQEYKTCTHSCFPSPGKDSTNTPFPVLKSVICNHMLKSKTSASAFYLFLLICLILLTKTTASTKFSLHIPPTRRDVSLLSFTPSTNLSSL